MEEGYYGLSHSNTPFFVVSRDGRGRVNAEAQPVLGFEFKCPFPSPLLKTPMHDEIPRYYVTQVALIFTSKSE
jgi:hypothetical protein